MATPPSALRSHHADVHSSARLRRAALALCLLAVALTAGACGKGPHAASAHTSAAQGPGVPAATVAVIEGWANALRAGQPKRAAAYWAIPSVMVNGPDESGRLTLFHIRNEHDAVLADETLSCGATLHATAPSGKYVRAIFLLGLRSGTGASKSGCSGPAGVDFLVRKGHIVRWLRAPTSVAPPAGSEPAEPAKPEETKPQQPAEPGAGGSQSI